MKYPGFKNIFATLELFLSKFKINYVDEIDRDSDNDYVNEIDRDSDNDDDIDIDSDSILAPWVDLWNIPIHNEDVHTNDFHTTGEINTGNKPETARFHAPDSFGSIYTALIKT